MVRKLRNWLLRLLFGFDIIDHLKSQGKLLDLTSSVAADGIHVKSEAKEKFIETTTQLLLQQQDQIRNLEQAMSSLIETIEVHQESFDKIAEAIDALSQTTDVHHKVLEKITDTKFTTVKKTKKTDKKLN